MSFSEFLATIREPALIPVAQHWNAVRGSRAMPCWRDIDPAAIKQQLSIVWAWRWDAARGDFIGRLAGQDIENAMGRSGRGRTMQDMFGDPAAAMIRARYLDVMRVPEIAHSTGRIYSRLRQSGGSAERIALPLGADDTSDGGVFGATIYRLGSTAPEDIIYDREREVRRVFGV